MAESETFTDNYLLFLLAQASAVASNAFHQELQDAGIPVSTWRILASLYPTEVLRVGSLADKCLLKQPTLTRSLDRLEQQDLVSRTPSAADRRTVMIKLTPKGRALTRNKIKKAKTHEATVLTGYSPDQIDELKNMLNTLIGNLQT